MAKPIINQQLEEIRDAILGLPTSGVQEAVDDWLDNHPEATTTVQDGSLTEEKFSPALKLATVKDYVTPEMFGAVGDGETDDTQAIQDALDAEGTAVVFANKTYNCGGVTLSADKTLYFNYTSLSAITDNQHHILQVTAHVVTYGRVALLGNHMALIGLDIGPTNGSGNSQIDFVFARYCKLWGVYLNDETLLLEMGKVHVSACGYKEQFTVTRNEQYKFAIDAGNDKEFFENHFNETALIVDTTDFKTRADGTKVPFNLVWRAETFEADENDTTGVITLTANTNNRISSDYTGERTVYILLGGGIGWKYGQGGATHIRFINSLANSVGFAPNGTNRISVDFMYSQSDGICIGCWGYNIGISIGTFGPEGPQTGIYIFSQSYSNITLNSVSNLLDSSNIATNVELNTWNEVVTIPTIQARRKIPFVYTATASNIIVNENYADDYIVRDITKITLGLNYINTTANSRTNRNPFGVKTFYVGRLNGAVHNKDITIQLRSELVTAGYTIQGGTDGTLVVPCTNDTYFIIRIMLLGTVFLVSKEAHNVIT